MYYKYIDSIVLETFVTQIYSTINPLLFVFTWSLIAFQAPYFHPLPAGNCSGVGAGGGSDCTAATNASLTEVDDEAVLPESVSQHTAVSTLCPPVHRPVQLLQVKAKGRFGALWMATCNGDHVAVKIFPASVSHALLPCLYTVTSQNQLFW